MISDPTEIVLLSIKERAIFRNSEVSLIIFKKPSFYQWKDYAEGQLCAPGNCEIDGIDLSDVYFACGNAQTVTYESCWDGVSA